jgi:hypothetical protein
MTNDQVDRLRILLDWAARASQGDGVLDVLTPSEVEELTTLLRLLVATRKDRKK